LKFRFAGFPVEIAPGALLLAGILFLLGLSWGWSFPYIFATIGVAAFSILFHEFGHATVARAFRLEPISMTLHGLGGFTKHAPSDSAGKELAVVLAGPAFGLILAVVGLVLTLLPLPDAFRSVAVLILYLNVLWSVFNLIPIYPMDGGQALGQFLQLFVAPSVAWPITWGVGLAGAVVLGILALVASQIFILFFAGMFAWRNLELLRAWRRRNQRA
jgi:Zn-dependent protease